MRPNSIILLQPEQATLCHALHQKIISGLQDHEKTFILPKPLPYFFNHASKGSGNALIGSLADGGLVAQAVIHHPTSDDPETGMSDMDLLAKGEHLSILQAASVLPEHRGQGLMNSLVEAWAFHAALWKRDHLLAEIDPRNAASWSAFLKAGLRIVSFGKDPDDGAPVFNAYAETARAVKRLMTPLFHHVAQTGDVSADLEDYDAHKSLLQSGYQGLHRDHEANKLIFRKAEPALPFQL